MAVLIPKTRLRRFADAPLPLYREVEQRFGAGVHCLFDDQLVSGTQKPSAAVSGGIGLQVYNGITTLRGVKTFSGNGTIASMLGVTGHGVYWTGRITLVTIACTGWSGTFTRQETVTQTTSGATGLFIERVADTMYLAYMSGTFDATNVLTGATSLQTATAAGTPVVTASKPIIEKTSDPLAVTPSVVCYCVQGVLPRSLAVFYAVDFSGTPKTVIMFADYPTTALTLGNIYANVATDNDTWATLMEATGVRHFHGLVSVTGQGTAGGPALLGLTGDSGTDNAECSVLWCDDIGDFVTNPATWKTNWGLDLSGAARNTYFAGAGAPYAILYGSQRARYVDVVPDETGAYGYGLEDTSDTPATNHKLTRFDFVHKTVTKVGRTVYYGAGWSGKLLSTGHIIIGTRSEYGSGVYTGNAQSYHELHVLNESRDDLILLKRFYRTDRAAPSTNSNSTLSDYTEWRNAIYTLDIGGLVAGGPPTFRLAHFDDQSLLTPETQYYRDAGAPALPAVNILANGRFQDSENLATDWDPTTYITATQETVTLDTASGTPQCLKLVATADSTAGYVEQTIDATRVPGLRGHWLTLSGRVYDNNAGGVGATLGIIVNGSDRQRATVVTAADAWQTMSLVVWVPHYATTLKIELYHKVSGTATAAVYWSDVVCALGTRIQITGAPSVGDMLPVSPSFRAITLDVSSASVDLTTNQAKADVVQVNGAAGYNQRVVTYPSGTVFSAIYTNSHTGEVLVKYAGGILGVDYPVLPPSVKAHLYGDGTKIYMFRLTPGDDKYITMTDADYTTVPSEWLCRFLRVSGPLTDHRNFVLPTIAGRDWVIVNKVSNSKILYLKTAAGATPVSLLASRTLWVYCDGTEIVTVT